MRALIDVEIRRLVARRLFRVLSILVILAFVTIATIAFVASDDDPARVAEAAEKRRVEIAQCVSDLPTMMDGRPPPEAVADPQQWCEDQTYGSDPRFPYADMQWILATLGVPMMMLGWLLGASSIGAEWANRTVMTTLTWDARRSRVLLAKAFAVGVVALVWISLLQLVFLTAMYPVGALEGSMAGVDAGWWGETAGMILRASGVATMAALFGLSLATIGRNTAAALGVGFVYLAVVEGLIRAFRPSWADWLIGENIGLFLVGDLDVNRLGHSQEAAGLLLAVYTTAVVGAALMVFRRRDVT